MFLYIGLSLWMFFLLIIGLRYEAVPITDNEYDIKKANKNLKVHRFLFVSTMLVLWAITAFRSIDMGNDTKVYVKYFNIFAREGINSQRTFEIGYQILNVIFSKISNDPHIFLIIMASIMYLFTGIYIYKYSKNILVCTCLFFCTCFTLYFSMLRQGIAMIIALYAYQMMKKNRKIIAIILVLLAISFHTSAIVMFLLFLKDKLFRKKSIVVLMTLFFCFLSASGIFNKIFLAILPRYNHYFFGQYAFSGWLAVSYSLIRNLIIYILIDKNIKSDSNSSVVRMNFILLLMFTAFGYSVNLFTRAGEYFYLIAIVELVNIIQYGTNMKNRKFWLATICIVSLIMFNVTLIYRPNWNHLYPYKFWS